MKIQLSSLTLLVILAVAPIAHASAPPCPYIWERTLSRGMSGPDVRALQQLLNADAATTIAAAGIGSPGNESEFLGARTAAALSRFQEKFASDILAPAGLTRGTGSAGPRTRAKLNGFCSASTSPATPADAVSRAQPTLTIERSEQPTATIAPAGAGGVPFTSFTLTAGSTDVTVRSITVMRVGAGADGAFESVVILDESGEEVAEERSLSSQHSARLPAALTIPAGTATTLTVYGNMAEDMTDYEGQQPVLRVVAIDASAPTSGTLPIDGTPQTINATLALGGATASLSPYDPALDRTLYINDANVRLSGIRITVLSQEELELSSIAWEQAGSAGPDDIANVATVIDGTSYPAERDGRNYVSTFTPAIRIKKGMTIDVHVRADLLPGAANRTVKFNIHESGDIALSGLQYGYGVGIAAASHTAAAGNSVFLTTDGTEEGEELTPFFSGSIVSVQRGGIISVSRN